MSRARELAELATGYDSGGSLNFRNRIINGDMRIAQRGTSANPTTTGYFTTDRWQQGASNALIAAIAPVNEQSTDAPSGFVNSFKYTNTNASGVLTGTQTINVNQLIEGTNISDLAWGTASAKTVTLSFWVSSSLTGTFVIQITNSALDRSYPATYTISAADTWEYKSVTISGDTTGTWLTTNGIGIRVRFSLGAGPDRIGTANAWASGNVSGTTGMVQLVETAGATFYITGVQLEVGSVATPFERRPYGTELSLCQRYYYSFVSGSNFPVMTSANYGSADSRGVVTFPTTMRGTPTLVSSSGTNHFIFFSNGTNSQCNSLSADVLSANSAELKNNTSISVTIGYASWLRTNSASASLAFSAEF